MNFSMLDLYFKDIKFNQLRIISKEPAKISVNHSFEFARSNDKTNYRCTINTIINSSDNRITLELKTIGIFKLEQDYEPTINDNQLLVNIIYPYIRSQVSLITTQPGLLPLSIPLLPPPLKNKDDNGESIVA